MTKILFINRCLGPGGKERRLIELIKGLSKYSEIKMELILTKNYLHYKEILQLDVKIHYVIRKSIVKDPKIVFDFFFIAKNFKPDIIHVWSEMEGVYAIPTKVMLNIPMINSQIADAPNNVSKSLIFHTIPFYFSDKIISNSYAGLRSYNAPKNKSIVIYNGFDFRRTINLSESERVRDRFKIKSSLVVGMVATFFKSKDYDSYIKAAIEILKTHQDVTFLCVGDGDDSKYKNMTREADADKILFLGKQNNIEEIMNICDIGVLATFTEGISNSVLEFMALGKPVVVAGEGGCEELIYHKKNGVLVKPGDYMGLGMSIKMLLDDEKLRKHYGENAIQIVKEKFNIQSMIEKYISVYDKV